MHALRFTSFILIPVSGFMFLFAHPVVHLLFEHGEFDSQATLMTSRCVQGLALGLWAVSCHSLLVRALNARHDTRSPMLIGLVSLFFSILVAVLLMGRPLSGQTSFIVQHIVILRDFFEQLGVNISMGAVGLCLASSIAFTLSLLLAWWMVHRSARSNGGDITWSPFVRSSIKSMLTVSIACAGTLFFSAEMQLQLPYRLIVFCLLLSFSSVAVQQRELFEILNMLRSRLS